MCMQYDIMGNKSPNFPYSQWPYHDISLKKSWGPGQKWTTFAARTTRRLKVVLNFRFAHGRSTHHRDLVPLEPRRQPRGREVWKRTWITWRKHPPFFANQRCRRHAICRSCWFLQQNSQKPPLIVNDIMGKWWVNEVILDPLHSQFSVFSKQTGARIYQQRLPVVSCQNVTSHHIKWYYIK